jgi:PAS domain S-box-containing protein
MTRGASVRCWHCFSGKTEEPVGVAFGGNDASAIKEYDMSEPALRHPALRILAASVAPHETASIHESLASSGIVAEIVPVPDEHACRQVLGQALPDLVLARVESDVRKAQALLQLRDELAQGVPVLFLAHPDDEARAIALLEQGAADYVLSDRPARLPHAVRSVLREAERAERLRSRQEKFESILEGTQAGTWEWNVQTGKTVFNERWALIVGYTLQELHPHSIRTWETLAHPDDFRETAALLDRHFKGETEYYDGECRMRHKDGHWIWVHDRGKVVSRTPDGAPLMMYGTHTDITARKQAEEDLRESEERARFVFEWNNAPMGLIDPVSGAFLNVNRQAEAFFGMTEEALRGTTIFAMNVQPPEEIVETLKTILNSTSHSFVLPHKHPDRDARIVEVHASPITFRGNTVIFITAKDITERHRAEEALRISEERLRLIYEALPVAIYTAPVDSEYDTTWIRGDVMKITGFDADEFVSEAHFWRDHIHPDDRDRVIQAFAGSVGNAESMLLYRWRGKDGTYRCFQDRWVLREMENGREYFGVIVDITEQKRTEERARNSEVSYRDLFNYVSDAVYVHDTEGRFIDVNAGVEAMYGYTREELLGKTPAFLAAPGRNDLATANEALRLAMDGIPQTIEFWGKRKDGTVFPKEVHLNRGRYLGENVVIVLARDITERLRAEADLLAAKDRAEKSEALKDAFVANISHEIRTPLNIILGYTDAIAEKFAPIAGEGDRRYFDSVQRGGERLMRTVDMILSISRLQSGEFTLHPTCIDIPALMQAIVADHQPLARKKQLLLTCIDACGNALVTADEYSITQAVSNLLHNAIKFTMKGGVELRVYRNEQTQICVRCRDTGIGISQEYLPSLFSRYSQEHNGGARVYEGLGLGMALVKEYLALNHAAIAVESEKGSGTTFTITFLDEVSAAPSVIPGEARSPSAPLVAAASASQGASPVALVIEDDDMTIDFMQVVLEEQYSIRIARSGAEAWQVLRAERVDIILMDISLADRQTGIELTQEIRQSRPHRNIPIIAVTAHAYDQDRDHCLDAGCDDFIRKPVNTAFLLERMQHLLAR